MASNKDIDHLLAILAQTDPNSPNSKIKLTDAEHFVKELGIVEGTARVHNLILYDTYRKWCERKAAGRKKLGMQFKKLFKQRKANGERYYYLNADPFDLSPENLIRVKSEYKQKHKKKYEWRQRKAEEKAAKEARKEKRKQKVHSRNEAPDAQKPDAISGPGEGSQS